MLPPSLRSKAAISTAGGIAPLWRRRDGRELYFVDPANRIQALATTLSPSFSAGAPEVLFTTDFDEGGGRQYDASPDGERFLLNLCGAAVHPAPRRGARLGRRDRGRIGSLTSEAVESIRSRLEFAPFVPFEFSIMPYEPATRLGAYEILFAIGAGGMARSILPVTPKLGR